MVILRFRINIWRSFWENSWIWSKQLIINSKKLNVAILDDYQNVSRDFANWDLLSDKIELDVFNKYIGKEKNCQIYYPNMTFYV